MKETPQDGIPSGTQEGVRESTGVARLYHDAATESPSPALDAAVLREARAAVAPRASRWSWGGWQARFAVLATVVFSFTLLLFSQQPARESPESNAIPERPGAARADTVPVAPAAPPVTSAPVQESGGASAPAAAAQDSMSKIVEPPAADSAPAPQATPPVAPPAAQPAPLSAPRAAPQVTSPAVAPLAPAADGPRLLQRTPESGARAGEGVAAPAAAARSGPAANSTMERAKAARAPDEWIARIRELRQQGQAAEAARELDALRKQYPALKLPDDLLAP